MSYSVYLSDSFKRSLKQLTRRFPRVRADLIAAIEEILFRLLYIVLPDRALICPLLIYAKSDWKDITQRELRALPADLKQDFSSET